MRTPGGLTVKEIKLIKKGMNPFEPPAKVRFYAPVLHGRFKRFKNKRQVDRAVRRSQGQAPGGV